MKIHVNSARYEDHNDSLEAAAAEVATACGIEGWDLAPRWADDQRDQIELDIPEWASDTYAADAAWLARAE